MYVFNTVAIGDVVYIKNFRMIETRVGLPYISVLDGYYKVLNRDPNSFRIIPAYHSANPGGSAVPAGPFGVLGNFSYQKLNLPQVH